MAADRTRAERDRRYRRLQAQGLAVYPVTIGGEVLNMLVRLGHLADNEATNKKQVSKAIAALLTEAAQH